MAENGVELARAFVTIIPSFEGAQGKITEQLLPSTGLERAANKTGAKVAAAFGSKFKKALAPLLTGGAIIGAFKGLYSIGDEFDGMMDTIRIGTGATGDALEAMGKTARNIAKTVPTSFESAGQSVADWSTRMGLSGKALEKVAAQSERLKQMGMESDINGLSAAFRAFGIEGESVAGGMDSLFQVSQATGVSIDTLAKGVQNTAPALKTLGYSFEDSISLFGQLDKAGLNSEQIMKSMSKSLVTLAKDGEAPKDAFKRVTREMADFIAKGDEAGALDLAGKVFGTKGAPQFIQALKDGRLNVDGLASSLGATSDTILDVGSKTDDFGEKWQMFKNKAKDALEPFSAAAFDGLGKAFDFIMPYLDSFGAWASEHTGVLTVLAGVISGVLTLAFLGWAGSIVAVNLAFLASPITWIVGAIAAIGVAVYKLWTDWNTVWGAISDTASTIWESITTTISDAWNSITTAVSDALTAVGDYISEKWNSVTSWTSESWNSIMSAISGAWNEIRGIVSSGTSSVGSFIQNGWDAASSFTTSGWDSIKSAVSSGIDGMMGFISSIPRKISGFFSNAGTWLYKAGKDVIQGFVNGITSAFSWVKKKLSNLTSMLPSWKGPAPLDKVILKPAGKLVIGGFVDGLESEYGRARQSLGKFTDSIQYNAAASYDSGSRQLKPSSSGALFGTVNIYNPVSEPSSTSLSKELAKVSAGVGSLV